MKQFDNEIFYSVSPLPALVVRMGSALESATPLIYKIPILIFLWVHPTNILLDFLICVPSVTSVSWQHYRVSRDEMSGKLETTPWIISILSPDNWIQHQLSINSRITLKIYISYSSIYLISRQSYLTPILSNDQDLK